MRRSLNLFADKQMADLQVRGSACDLKRRGADIKGADATDAAAGQWKTFDFEHPPVVTEIDLLKALYGTFKNAQPKLFN